MIPVLYKIWQFLKDCKHVLITIWFAVHGVLRFIFRMPASILVFIDTLPLWVVPVSVICLAVGFGCFLVGRQH